MDDVVPVRKPGLEPDGENGGVSASSVFIRVADPRTRGVEFLESAAVLDSPVCGVSKREPPEL